MLARHRGVMNIPEHYGTITAHIYAMIAHVDQQAGRVLEAVKRLGREDDTIVVFSSDHGHWHGDHGLAGKGGLLTRGLVRTPLLIRVPGSRSAGNAARSLVSAVDLMPTLLELLGQPVPPGLDGRSFAALFGDPAQPHRGHVRIEWMEAALGAQAVQIRTERHALTRYAPSGETLLFDLERDPMERWNFWPRQADEGDVMRLEAALLDEGKALLGNRSKPWARC